MLEFVKQYWKVIALIILVLLDLLILILKKRPVKVCNAVTAVISDILPQLILEAENQYPSGHGSDKLELVIQLCENYLIGTLGLDSATIGQYRELIKLRAEAILSTPQKKGN